MVMGTNSALLPHFRLMMMMMKKEKKRKVEPTTTAAASSFLCVCVRGAGRLGSSARSGWLAVAIDSRLIIEKVLGTHSPRPRAPHAVCVRH
jgi:hypothetical protein